MIRPGLQARAIEDVRCDPDIFNSEIVGKLKNFGYEEVRRTDAFRHTQTFQNQSAREGLVHLRGLRRLDESERCENDNHLSKHINLKPRLNLSRFLLLQSL